MTTSINILQNSASAQRVLNFNIYSAVMGAVDDYIKPCRHCMNSGFYNRAEFRPDLSSFDVECKQQPIPNFAGSRKLN